MIKGQARYRGIMALLCISSLVLVAHLFEHQILNTSYRSQARARTLMERTISAPRGIIYDRNDDLVVVNEPTYELDMIYREIDPDMDIDLFCSLLNISGAFISVCGLLPQLE